MDYYVLLLQHLGMTAHFKIFSYMATMVMIAPVPNTSFLPDRSLQVYGTWGVTGSLGKQHTGVLRPSHLQEVFGMKSLL